MASNLNLYFTQSALDWGLEESFRSSVGTPIIAIRKRGNFQQRSDIYRLTFSAVVPGTSATCHVATDQPHNPSRNTPGVAVVLDGTTWNANVIEGLEIQFSSSGSFTSAWAAQVFYGSFWDTVALTENHILDVGTVVAGNTTTAKRIKVKNDGADLGASCTIRAVNGVRIKNDQAIDRPFTKMEYTTVSQTVNFSPGYAISFANKVGSVIDIKVDGLNRDVKRVDTGVVFPGGAAVPADGVVLLEWTTGPLTGLRFILSSSVANADTATIFVSNGAQYVEIAPDVSGVAGTWQAGTTPLTLTQDGGSQTGEIAAAAAAFFHRRVKTIATDSPVGNQRHAQLVTEALGV